MKFGQNATPEKALSLKALAILLMIVVPLVSTARSAENTPQTLIWDTRSPLGDAVDVQAKANWRLVPSNLLTFEADPNAASSDPGYYGREYAFEGDAVVENTHIIAAFCSQKGKAVIYSKSDPQTPCSYRDADLEASGTQYGAAGKATLAVGDRVDRAVATRG